MKRDDAVADFFVDERCKSAFAGASLSPRRVRVIRSHLLGNECGVVAVPTPHAFDSTISSTLAFRRCRLTSYP
jgi:hypothetical protein